MKAAHVVRTSSSAIMRRALGRENYLKAEQVIETKQG